VINSLLVLASFAVPGAGDSVYGVVRMAGSGDPVPDARVWVSGGAATLSDSAGRYALRALGDARIEVHFERLGFESLTIAVLVPPSGATRVDADLVPAPLPLPSVEVNVTESAPARVPSLEADEIGLSHVTPGAARRNPLVGDPDALAALTATPSVSGRREFAPSLPVRGGVGGENLVLLDGVPWRGPRPLAGIAGLLPSGAVASVDLHTAAPPARYGGALSGMIVVHPQNADPRHLTADGVLDPTFVEQTVGTPLPLHGATLLLSGRHTYRSVFDPPEGASNARNGFSDAFGRLSLSGSNDALDLYFLGNRGRLVFPANAASSGLVSQGQQPIGLHATTGNPLRNRFTGSGLLGSAVWTHQLSGARSSHARLWYSTVAGDVAWRSLGVASHLRDVGVSADYVSDRTELGLSLSRTSTTYRVQDTAGSAIVLDAAPVVVAAFASQRWAPVSHWTLSLGMRLTGISTWGVLAEPRAWTRASLGDRLAVSIGYARLHQYVHSARNETSVLDALLGADLTMAGSSGRLAPARSDQASVTLDARVGTHATLVLEGYQRWLSRLALVAPTTRLPFSQGAIAVGRGSALGGDAVLTYETSRLDGSVQVGGLRAMRTGGTIAYRPSDALRHLAVGLAYRVPNVATVRAALWVGTGRRMTPVYNGFEFEPVLPWGEAGELAGSPETAPGPLNARRLPTYARLDWSVSRDWELTSLGAGSRISTTLTVTNLLNRRNVLAHVAAPDGYHTVLMTPRTLWLRLRWHLAG
jgi:hypothetical protein